MPAMLYFVQKPHLQNLCGKQMLMAYVENPARTEASAAFMWSKAGVVHAAR